MKKEDFEAWKAEMRMAMDHDKVACIGVYGYQPRLTTVWSTCAMGMRRSRVPHRIRDKLYRFYLTLLAAYRFSLPYPEAWGSVEWDEP